LWNEVFGPKYGTVAPPPYTSIKIPTRLRNKTDIKHWLAQMEDRALSARIAHWMQSNNKQCIGVFLLPLEYVQSHGLPSEIKTVLDTKRVVLELTNGYRLLLESIGFFCKEGWTLGEMGY
jgi:hypothetical protein